MINTMTRTYKAVGPRVNVLEVDIHYEIGGMNYFTGRPSQRGYYFSITPYEGDGMFRSYRAFSGSKACVLPCKRQSRKRFEEACSMMGDLIDAYLPSWLEENGITIGDEYTEKLSER